MAVAVDRSSGRSGVYLQCWGPGQAGQSRGRNSTRPRHDRMDAAAMTPAQFRSCLSVLGLSYRGLAGLLFCSPRLARLWAAGDASIPEPVATWLATWAQLRVERPDPKPPTDWRRRRVTA